MNYKSIPLVAALAAATLSTSAFAVTLSHEINANAGGAINYLNSKYDWTTSALHFMMPGLMAPGGSNYPSEYASTSSPGLEVGLGYFLNLNGKFDYGFAGFYNTMRNNTRNEQLYRHSVYDLFGIHFLPGYYFLPKSKIFLDFGMVNVASSLNLKYTSLTDLKDQSKTRHVSGYRLGAGFETMVFDNFSARLAYAYMDGFGSTEIQTVGTGFVYKVTPKLQTVTASVVYHFHI